MLAIPPIPPSFQVEIIYPKNYSKRLPETTLSSRKFELETINDIFSGKNSVIFHHEEQQTGQ